MRLFVAIELTDEARAAIAAEQARLKADRDLSRSAKWVRPDHMHLTLAFLGEIEDRRAEGIADAMRREIDAPPFDIAFDGLGVFPPRGAPRVLWVGLIAGQHETVGVQRAVAVRLAQLGVEPELRPFHPHLTLARWRDARRSDRPRALGAAAHEVARIHVAGVTLFQSRLSPAGVTYTSLAHAPLSGR